MLTLAIPRGSAQAGLLKAIEKNTLKENDDLFSRENPELWINKTGTTGEQVPWEPLLVSPCLLCLTSAHATPSFGLPLPARPAPSTFKGVR